jgi:hypothetical protein
VRYPIKTAENYKETGMFENILYGVILNYIPDRYASPYIVQFNMPPQKLSELG